MTRTERATLQSALLDNVRCSAKDRPTQVELGRIAGCDRTEFPKFSSGERHMDLDEIVALGEEYGAVAVLQPIAQRLGAHVVAGVPAAKDHGDPMLLTLDCGNQMIAIQRALAMAQEDGLVDFGEAEDLHRQITAFTANVQRVAASIEARRQRPRAVRQ